MQVLVELACPPSRFDAAPSPRPPFYASPHKPSAVALTLPESLFSLSHYLFALPASVSIFSSSLFSSSLTLSVPCYANCKSCFLKPRCFARPIPANGQPAQTNHPKSFPQTPVETSHPKKSVLTNLPHAPQIQVSCPRALSSRRQTLARLSLLSLIDLRLRLQPQIALANAFALSQFYLSKSVTMFATRALRQAAAHAERTPMIKFIGPRSIPCMFSKGLTNSYQEEN